MIWKLIDITRLRELFKDAGVGGLICHHIDGAKLCCIMPSIGKWKMVDDKFRKTIKMKSAAYHSVNDYVSKIIWVYHMDLKEYKPKFKKISHKILNQPNFIELNVLENWTGSIFRFNRLVGMPWHICCEILSRFWKLQKVLFFMPILNSIPWLTVNYLEMILFYRK